MTISRRDDNENINTPVSITFDQLNELQNFTSSMPANGRKVLTLDEVVEMFATDNEKLNIQDASNSGKIIFLKRRVAFNNKFQKVSSNRELYARADLQGNFRVIDDDQLSLE